MTKNVSKARVSGNTNSSYKANRYDTKENWTTANPVLNKGEIVIETDAGKARLKCGDGVNHYNDLEYIYAEGTGYTGDNVGDVTFSIAPTIPANKHELDGSQELRTDRAALWSWLEAHPEWLKTETEWQEIANANGGRCNYYSKGDEWSNFRYPKVIADQGRYLVELVGGAESDQPISESQYEFIMNEIGKVQSDISSIETDVANAKYPVYTFTKNITLNANTWTNTGIYGENLASGVYIVEFYSTNTSLGQQLWGEHFTGLLYWFNGGTNSSNGTNITLHSCGHANNQTTLQARTLRSSGTDSQPYVKLQLYSNYALGNADWIFKFTKIM